MESAAAIQIVTPVDHTFQLNIESLTKILNADDLKDRYAVVISIAGALRKGKSFLLNFILKYLYAQYKRHNLSNWASDAVIGFKSRGGRQPETTGIWMWSEIFTHDFSNGEKVAIILLDTQGIFDNRSSTKDNTVTFAVSMMLASLQCFNVMHQIQEDDLQHLELFSEYGRFALQQSAEKQFQKLLFIIRDWPYSDESPYGDGQPVIDEFLKETTIQSDENRQLRQNIKSCFEQISAFLMPYPGKTVAMGRFNGNIQQIDEEFIKFMEMLISSICAPDKIIVKKINGEKVKTQDLTILLQTYVNIFNGGTLPEPKSILLATAATSNLILFNQYYNLYIESMQKHIEEKSHDENKPYFNFSELQEIHEQTKNRSISEFQAKPKLGGEKVIQPFETKLVHDIDEKYAHFIVKNDMKRNSFEELMRTKTRSQFSDCLKLYIDRMQASFSSVQSFFIQTDLQKIHENAKNEAISMFKTNVRSDWDESFFNATLDSLESDIRYNYLQFERENEKKEKFAEDMKHKSEEEIAKAKAELHAAETERALKKAEAINQNTMSYSECFNQYMNTMRKTLVENQPFINQNTLQQKHEQAKASAVSAFNEKRVEGGDERAFSFRLVQEIDTNFNLFMQQNETNRQKKADSEEIKKMQDRITDLQIKIANMKRGGGGGGLCSIL